MTDLLDARRGYMRCSEFLAGFSDFRDNRLSAGEADRFAAHRSECRACARYEAVLEAGVGFLRDTSVDPREDFRPRLQHSIYALDEEARRRALPRGPNAIPILAMAAVAAVLILGPRIDAPEPEAELSPIVAGAPTGPTSSPIAVPVTVLELDPGPGSLGVSPLWAESNSLLYEYSTLNARYREPTLVRTDLR